MLATLLMFACPPTIKTNLSTELWNAIDDTVLQTCAEACLTRKQWLKEIIKREDGQSYECICKNASICNKS